MEIELSEEAKKEIVKYSQYLAKNTKFDRDKIQELTTKFEEQLKKNINSSGNKHSDSIFPKKTKFGKDYKMYVDKSKHRVIFYKIEKDDSGNEIAKIYKCPHSTELKKELDIKDIKPLNNADPELLLDYITVEKEDKVKDDSLTDEERDEYNKKEEELEKRISNKKEGIEKEDKDENGNPRQYKTGPQGGKYYRVKIDGKWGDWHSITNENLKNIKSYITESKMVSLLKYIKGLIGVK